MRGDGQGDRDRRAEVADDAITAQPLQHLVIGPPMLGGPLEAIALEPLHDRHPPDGRVDLARLRRARVAELGESTMRAPEAVEPVLVGEGLPGLGEVNRRRWARGALPSRATEQ